MGLVFGWLRSVRPTFGRIPEPALWVFDTIGLAVFIGVVGLNAGPSFVAGLRETGPSLLVVGFVVAVTPHVVALLFGRYVLKMNPVILLGACAGAGTVTAALRAIQDEAREQAAGARLHRALRDRQHPADRVGPGDRHAHAGRRGRDGGCHVETTARSRWRPGPSSLATSASRHRLRRQPLPTVVVLATGGTIAGAAAQRRAGRLTSRGRWASISCSPPCLRRRSSRRCAGEQISNIGSQDMNDEVWLKLARRVNELAAMNDVAGIVITHGTDTIEETAYFLNLVVKSRKPVVLTAAMRPSTALSADGPLNFFNAVAVAANKDAGRTRRARGRQRLDPRRVVADQDEHDGGADVPVAGPGLIGTVAYGEAEFYRGPVGRQHVELGVLARRRHDAAARGHHHGLREHGRRAHRRGGGRRRQGPRHRGCRQRQHDGGSREGAGRAGEERASSACARRVCSPVASVATSSWTTTSWGSWRRSSSTRRRRACCCAWR